MLGKLSQLKNFITHAVTSLQSQRPTLPSDPHLQWKLKFMLDYILRNPTEDQFKADHSLQCPEMTVNELLKQIYHSQSADTTQIASIVHFYTFLLINCNNQLVICKIASDSFVIELTQVYLNRLAQNVVNNNVQVQEINNYKIALIKAYVSRINQETIKYMIVNQRMKVFENCVYLYEQFMTVEEQEQFGVEATCISNCILIIVRYLAEHPEYSPNICYQEGEKGVIYLLVKMVENIHNSMQSILNSSDLEEQQFELLKDKILFLVDVVNSITSADIKGKIISETAKQLADLRELFKEIVLQYAIIFNQTEQNYLKSLELIKVLLKLLAIYYDSSSLLPLFAQSLLPMLHKFNNVFKHSLQSIASKQKQLNSLTELNEKEVEAATNAKSKLIYIFCSNMQILAAIMRSGQYLSRRNSSHQKERQLKTIVINILIDTIELLLGEEGEHIQELLCYKSIKLLLLSLMQLTVQNEHTLHQYSVTKFHQFMIDKLRRHLKRTQNWDYVVLNYQSFLKVVSQNLLNLQDTGPQQYAFCQFHDPNRHKTPVSLEALTNTIFLNECCRNFRFMIVEKTKVDLKDIKLQKNYHNNFITPGWGYEPGKEITEAFTQICHLSHLSRGMKIPISVIEDEECLLFVHSEAESKKIVLNIRYKSIQGFIVDKEVVHIRLKGLQEVLVQAPSKHQKEGLIKFKQYLIQKRDKSRSKELKFIYYYLDLYYQDNRKLIEEMGQAEIEAEADLDPTSPENEDQSITQQVVEVSPANVPPVVEQKQIESVIAEIVDV